MEGWGKGERLTGQSWDKVSGQSRYLEHLLKDLVCGALYFPTADVFSEQEGLLCGGIQEIEWNPVFSEGTKKVQIFPLLYVIADTKCSNS